MDIFSISALSNLFPGQPVKAEVVASSEGKSLVMVNGRPIQVDSAITGGELSKVAAVEGNVAAVNAVQISPERILSQAGLEKNEQNLQILEALRQYGVPLTPENAGKAAAIAATMPEFALNRVALGTVALLLLRRLPLDSAPLLYDYLNDKLRFGHLLGEDHELGKVLRTSAGFADILKQLHQMLTKRQKIEHPLRKIKAETSEKLAENLMLQDLLTEAGEAGQESRIYFQWPLFWANQDLPDTLEGEAFFMPGDKKQGFCLRLLVSPPSLGKIEVAMNQLEQTLWVHFGADPGVLGDIRSIFPLLSARLETSGFAEVRLTTGKLRKIEHFLLESVQEHAVSDSSRKLDLRA